MRLAFISALTELPYHRAMLYKVFPARTVYQAWQPLLVEVEVLLGGGGSFLGGAIVF